MQFYSIIYNVEKKDYYLNFGGVIMWSTWLIIAGVFLVIEASTTNFLTFWLAIGAIFAMFTSFFIPDIIIQTAVFIVTSTILILFTKPLVDRYINKPAKSTNTDLLIKRHGVVTVAINSNKATGQVRVNSQIWSAKSFEDSNIPEGTEVEIMEVEGVKLVVSPLKISETVM
jgi:membrane protein implicated in regulation of membrane protease activity